MPALRRDVREGRSLVRHPTQKGNDVANTSVTSPSTNKERKKKLGMIFYVGATCMTLFCVHYSAHYSNSTAFFILNVVFMALSAIMHAATRYYDLQLMALKYRHAIVVAEVFQAELLKTHTMLTSDMSKTEDTSSTCSMESQNGNSYHESTENSETEDAQFHNTTEVVGEIAAAASNDAQNE